MVSTPDEELIESAQAVLNPHHVGDRVLGDVGATLVTDRGNRYSGVCIDTVGQAPASVLSTARLRRW